MNDRIKTIRSALKLTQAEFGKRLGLSQNYIWMIERGDRTPSDRTLMDLCREFSVNEVWLREGIGPMFVERSRRDDLFDYARRILGGDLSDTEATTSWSPRRALATSMRCTEVSLFRIISWSAFCMAG